MARGSSLSRHWHGTLAVPVMLAGPVAGGMALLWIANATLGHWPLWALLALNLPVALWLWIGAFRAADRVMGEGSTMAGFAAYGSIAATALLISVTLLARDLPSRTVTATGPPQAAPRLPETRQRVQIIGDISYDHFKALEARLATGAPLTSVALESDGGNIYAARGLARLIEEAGLETLVTTRCFSACTLVFAAGQPRRLAPEAALGFHGYALHDSSNYGPIRHVNPEDEARKDRASLSRRGFSPAFVARVHTTPPPGLWRPTRAELLAGGVLSD